MRRHSAIDLKERSMTGFRNSGWRAAMRVRRTRLTAWSCSCPPTFFTHM